jgi:hypothetical protein
MQLLDEGRVLDLGIEELESLEAPSFWAWIAGIGAGVVIGGGVLYLGIAITYPIARSARTLYEGDENDYTAIRS